ncbi:MAG: TIGR00730 family Rossman fold protein [Acidobacteriia bacterium]|nr:TIGR00730 family Rossman fold protein [Terriglobia bacterium]
MDKPQNKARGQNHQPQLAYRTERFLESGDARTLRILSEYLLPQSRLRRAGVQNTVVFFGSARILPREEAQTRLHELEHRSDDGKLAASAAELKAARTALQMSRYYEEARELARLVTEWSQSLKNGTHFLVVCSGGGPGIMEAANRGAFEAGGISIGFNIKLPSEQRPNPYITPELSLLFRYFFMRKLWFAQPCKALIVFPGGFGTMDEMWEFLTLTQTRKLGHRATILLYGSKYWRSIINFRGMLDTGTITEEDLKLVRFADTPHEAFGILKKNLIHELGLRGPQRRLFV